MYHLPYECVFENLNIQYIFTKYIEPQVRSYHKSGFNIFQLIKYPGSSLTVSGKGSVHIVTQRKFGLFGHQVSEPTTFTWAKNDAALFMATKGNIVISEPNEKNKRIPVAWPRRT